MSLWCLFASISVGAIGRGYAATLDELGSHPHGRGDARRGDFIVKTEQKQGLQQSARAQQSASVQQSGSVQESASMQHSASVQQSASMQQSARLRAYRRAAERQNVQYSSIHTLLAVHPGEKCHNSVPCKC